MKTAISVPDDVFVAAEETARQLGMSRSELYTRAVRAYIESNRRRRITQQIDRVLEEVGDDGVDPVLTRMQMASLPEGEW